MKTAILILFLVFSTNVSAAIWDVPRFIESPESLQVRADYVARTDGLPTYLGYAPNGAATSESEWIVFKYTYDGNDQMTLKQTAVNVTWDDRASHTYN